MPCTPWLAAFALFHMLSCLKMLTEDSSYELSHFKGGLPTSMTLF
ncbi:hypothetical protein [Piscirickettsia salmonis]|nr:hypothetical protein [Piscirickettsia salmonis]